MDLKLDPDDLNTCVQCGLCLPSCPTYRVTGDETRSPRGRIALMREVQLAGAPVTPEVVASFETCVQCRGCEPACPSSVPYGHLMEQARETLADAGTITPWWQRVGLELLTRPRLLRSGSTVLALAQRLRLVPRRLGLPARLPLRRKPFTAGSGPASERRLATGGSNPTTSDPTTSDPTSNEVYLFTGCVMDAWQRGVHLATERVLLAAGFDPLPTGDAAPCCGALHTHAGLVGRSRELAQSIIDRLGPERPILVNSAGCGAAMKEYGHLLGTAEAEAFSARVYDIHEWLAAHADRLPDVGSPLALRVAVQDPCHLRHVQRVHRATREVLAPYVDELVELGDDGLCCGAGGAYSLLQPGLAGDIRSRKLSSIDNAGADVVASANPGCSLHLQQTGVETVHPMELVSRCLVLDGASKPW